MRTIIERLLKKGCNELLSQKSYYFLDSNGYGYFYIIGIVKMLQLRANISFWLL
ncbi:hypothetical protein [Ehrlichia muris]|uniref:hypothetical protein n=1 Tax=Ehrlichia muris TaxID=35795 RepID=UPI0037C07AF8